MSVIFSLLPLSFSWLASALVRFLEVEADGCCDNGGIAETVSGRISSLLKSLSSSSPSFFIFQLLQRERERKSSSWWCVGSLFKESVGIYIHTEGLWELRNVGGNRKGGREGGRDGEGMGTDVL